mmetsp:Transcript_12374/g.33404  ORF Transcript_12374/g.33404 Transcript_12374/m.33404 type:complete len:93 (-) Transcript_12374:102-380(-)
MGRLKKSRCGVGCSTFGRHAFCGDRVVGNEFVGRDNKQKCHGMAWAKRETRRSLKLANIHGSLATTSRYRAAFAASDRRTLESGAQNVLYCR